MGIKIYELIQKLDETDKEWKEKIQSVEDLTNLEGGTLKRQAGEVINFLRNCLKEQKEDEVREFQNAVQEASTADAFLKYAEKTLIYYNSLKTLRMNEKENEEFVRAFLKDAFERYIVRFDPSLMWKYSQYHMESSKDMEKALCAVECLTEYYVQRLWVKEYISRDFGEESGLKKESCEFYAELVERYFSDIRMNMVMHEVLADS